MKVRVDNLSGADAFIPYTVTFVIRTSEEQTRFHDRVAIKVTNGAHEFIGNIYKRGLGKAIGEAEFDI